MEKKFVFKTEEDTMAFGAEFAKGLKAGDVIALTGDLGAGKTAMTRAVARGLGITSPVTSPTFTIVQEYEGGRLPLYHFDIYRVHDEDELFELGFDEYLNGKGICFIEWADLIPALLPPETIFVRFSRGDSDDERKITICR